MEYVALALVGLCIGSFANVCIHRLPKNESLMWPASHCPSCKGPIRWFDNIPLVSYLLLKGRCRHCHTRISPRYPLVEFCFGVVWLTAGWRSDFQLTLLIPGLLLLSGLLVAAFTDLDCRLIPNEITATLIIGGLTLSFWNPLLGDSGFGRIADSVGGLAWGGGLLWGAGAIGQRLWKKDAMGGGDIKLAAGMGTFLGWKGMVIALVVASFLGAACGIGLILAGKIKRKDYIPFGPFLSLGGIAIWFWLNLK